MSAKNMVTKLLHTSVFALVVALSGNVQAAELSITDNPLFLSGTVPPLNLLVMGRDHKLYYEAYNDASDLDNDGVLDTKYRGYILKSPAPAAGSNDSLYKIDYYGYFDSYKCYNYVGGLFDPVSTTTTKTCSGYWSGDYLNYLTTSRIDALRKVLYGGDRSTDTASDTVLERSYIPQDAHSWGKEYTNVATDGFNISQYTPFAIPTAGQRYLFANTTPRSNVANGSGVYALLPLLRKTTVADTVRIWNWVSKEVPVAHVASGSIDGVAGTPVVTDYTVRVKVCKAGLEETNCQRYPGSGTPTFKPTGLLQSYGEGASPRMFFGLMTGSYRKNTSGGVLREPMGSLTNMFSAGNAATDEISPITGIFSGVNGIITTFNRLHTTGFGTTFSYTCGLASATTVITEGQCQMWGNPIAEIMYEGERYLAGKAKSPAFDIAGDIGEENQLPGGGLPLVATWTDPYASQPQCAKPFQTVISDINPSYDTDQLPGAVAAFTAGTQPPNDLSPVLNVGTLADTIWTNEFGGPRTVFIGQNATINNGAPTAKTVTSFRNIRGLAPEEPTKRGGYYSASVAYHGHINDIGTDAGSQKITTFAVALASPLPRISIPVGSGTVTLVPFAKSVANGAPAPPVVAGNIDQRSGSFQPTNQIVDFYVDTITPTSGTFRVNFEDVEQGADHDMDAIATYTYNVVGSQVQITVASPYAAGGITQHMGYIISGTTHDGIYLEIRDQITGNAYATDPDYFLDTPPGFNPAVSGDPPAPATTLGWADATILAALPFNHTRTFDVGTAAGAILLKDPLWYAAKWGSFKNDANNSNANNLPDVAAEWDENGDGTPDNYFLVTNALTLGEKLDAAFREILDDVGSASSASVNTGSISSETRVYQAKFNSADWTGQLLSFQVLPDNPVTTTVNEAGTLSAPEWDAGLEVPAHGSRVIITTNTDSGANVAAPFRWASIGANRQAQLKLSSTDTRGAARLDYLRGDTANEQDNAGLFRNRSEAAPPDATTTLILGDIVSSSPIYVGRPAFNYSDTLESAAYSTFVSSNANRTKMVYVGANDGMLHGFDATTGAERLGFIPGGVFGNLLELTKPNYTHRFFVDGTPTVGDAFYGGNWHTVLLGSLNKGGKSIFALDITNPSGYAEASASSVFRWEFTDADLGYTYSRPAIVRMHNGKWAAVFGNGYNSTGATGNAFLYIVDIETGSIIKKISTGAGAVGTPNGLATPAAVDTNGDSIVDYVYAGDLLGNLWKFNVRDSNTANWDVAYINGGVKTPLFVATDGTLRQPITSKPEVGRGPKGVGMVVLFGTGKFLEQIDKDPTQTQSFYGVLDANTGTLTDTVSDRSALQQQTILVEQTFTFGSVTVPLRVTSQNAINAVQRGWFMDFLSPTAPFFRKEMQVSNSVLRNGRVIFTTLIPDSDPCSSGGTSWLMEMDALSGARLNESPFDNNRDGVFTTGDYVTIMIGGVPTLVPVSGMQSEVGIAQGPGILFDPGTSGGPAREYKYLSGSTSNASGSNLQRIVENPGPNATGRQSWRQIK